MRGIAAFERRKIGQIAVGVPFDRETICSCIYFHSFGLIVQAYVIGANIDTFKRCVDEMALLSHILLILFSVFVMHF